LKWWLAIAALLTLAAAATPGLPPGGSAAADLLARGEWVRAAEAGRAQGDPIGRAIAGRWALGRAAYVAGSKTDATALVREADRYIAAAVDDAPDDYFVRLQEATAVAYRAALTRSPSAAKQAKMLFSALTVSEPGRAEGWAALGAWHGESVISASGFIARTVLGATRDKMDEHLDKAARLDPKSPVPPAFHGLLLVRMGDYADAAPYLRQAGALAGRDAYETMVRRQAQAVEKRIAGGDRNGARALADSLAPFGRFVSPGPA